MAPPDDQDVLPQKYMVARMLAFRLSLSAQKWYTTWSLLLLHGPARMSFLGTYIWHMLEGELIAHPLRRHSPTCTKWTAAQEHV
jgi:hypothetical protein